MKTIKKVKNRNNKKNIVCVVLIIILLAVLILTLYFNKRDITKYILVNANISSSIMQNVIVDEAIYLEKVEDEEVKNLIENIRSEYGLNTSNFGFFYYNVNTRKYYLYNEDKYFTAASTVKVPVAMYYYEKINNGEFTLESTLKYTSNNFEAGGGDVTNKYKAGSNIKLSVLLEELIVDSDNTANNILIGNIGFKAYRKEIKKYSDRDLSSTFYSSNVTTPGYSFDVIMYLYKHSDKFPKLLEDMKKSSFGKYLKEYLDYDVAHKYGSYNGYVHDYGIIYGKDTYIVGVFTKGKNNADKLIANIGKRLIDTVEKNEE